MDLTDVCAAAARDAQNKTESVLNVLHFRILFILSILSKRLLFGSVEL